MSLVLQINEDLKNALKAGDSIKLSTLRMVKTALKNKEIELGHELSDDEAVVVIQKEAKQRRDAEREFIIGNRVELADKEANEAKLLTEYLPKQLSEDEVLKIINDTIAETGISVITDMGKLMSVLMPKIQGKADGSMVSRLVKEKLSGSK